eukprot:TRINITY_DN23815_c0_g1_i1.p1 TRINITY_DN23815_c0_g1~~TRINITY_DN23815_c0_g1_i1.p1  ORF type:complete len:862 (+),score=196.05 TRINITY_DN23815_c0_g1_i1:123-2588(+)
MFSTELDRIRQRAVTAEERAELAAQGLGAASMSASPEPASEQADAAGPPPQIQEADYIRELRMQLQNERSISEDRLRDIRALQAQVHQSQKSRQDSASSQEVPPNAASLKKALDQEQRRARLAEETAAERLQDIRMLQQQLVAHERGVSAGGNSDVRERSRAEWAETRLRDVQSEAVALRAQMDEVKRQYAEALRTHQEALDDWHREREVAREREEILIAEGRLREEQLARAAASSTRQSRDREADLRRQAGKESLVAEGRLDEVRSLQKQVTQLHEQIADHARVQQADREQLLIVHREDLASVRSACQAQLEGLRAQLAEERQVAAERLRVQQQLERQVAELGDSLSLVPEGIEARTREQQRALEAALAAHRDDADAMVRRHKLALAELEKQVAAEKRRTEAKENELRVLQKQLAEARIAHQSELAAVMRGQEEKLEGHRAQLDEAEGRAREREDAALRQLDDEKRVSEDRLRELQVAQKRYQDVCALHAQELQRQQETREQQLKESRSREDALRRQNDQQLNARDSNAAERERQLLAQREEALASALREFHEREEETRRLQDERVQQLKHRHKEELERRVQEETKRRLDWERQLRKLSDSAREREIQAQQQADAATESAAHARRQAEALSVDVAAEAQERQREREDDLRRSAALLREAEERAALRSKEAQRAQQDAEASRLVAQEAAQARTRAEQQLAALETELARQVEASVSQREQLGVAAVNAEQWNQQIQQLRADAAQLRTRTSDTDRLMDAQRAELSRLATENSRLAAENVALHEREQRLRDWAHGTVGSGGVPGSGSGSGPRMSMSPPRLMAAT